MHEFETFVYLDTQKTGSSFISYILSRHSSEKELLHSKHQPVGERYDPNKFHFISVRDPLDQYISLYSYGCQEGGSAFNRVQRSGNADLYDSTWRGFRRWLKFVLDLDNTAVLLKRRDYEPRDYHQIIGFQTYRFLELALPDADSALHDCKSRDEIRAAFKAKSIPQFTIRHESFNTVLVTLLSTRLRNSIASLDDAMETVRSGWRMNASKRVDQFEDDPRLGPKVRNLLAEREWLLMELFGYKLPE